MEDVLDVYAQPYDPKQPTVCIDEKPVQLISETRTPIAAQPAQAGHTGQVERYDNEYKREGTANLFGIFEPHLGQREIRVTSRRTKCDFAHILKHLVDVRYTHADKIKIVCDNLNTHHPGVLYEAFEPEEARRIARKLEFHYTPKHASWLNMVEIEFSVLERQCLDRRIPNVQFLTSVTSTWANQRNKAANTVHWHFGCVDARRKLARLYPLIIV
jgi:transposase